MRASSARLPTPSASARTPAPDSGRCGALVVPCASSARTFGAARDGAGAPAGSGAVRDVVYAVNVGSREAVEDTGTMGTGGASGASEGCVSVLRASAPAR